MKKKEMLERLEAVVPQKPWFSLKEACEAKGLGYKNSFAKRHLQPNGGIPDGIIGGKKRWTRTTIMDWILMTDEELEKGGDNDAR